MEKERKEYLERIRRLEEENRRLWAEINRLRHDREYIESLARKKLGVLKENEVIYRFKHNSKNLEEGY
jgi:cell division protein FtsB